MTFREYHPKALQAAVFHHRLANPDLNLDVTGGWTERLLSDICSQNEHLDCEDVENPGRWPNLTDVVGWVRSMKDWTLTGFSVVPQEESERRAAICVTCPHNQIISGCAGCHGVGEIVSALTGNRTTSVDDRLNACRVCAGCSLKAKVHLPKEVIDISAYAAQLPKFCWLVESASTEKLSV